MVAPVGIDATRHPVGTGPGTNHVNVGLAAAVVVAGAVAAGVLVDELLEDPPQPAEVTTSAAAARTGRALRVLKAASPY